MIELSLRVDAKEALGRVHRLGGKLPSIGIRKALNDAGTFAASRLRKDFPKRTGRTAKTIGGGKVIKRGRGFSLPVGSSSFVARLIDVGVATHRIEPLNVRALRIPGIGFRASAMHPGVRGQRIWQRVADRDAARVSTVFAASLSRFVARFR